MWFKLVEMSVRFPCLKQSQRIPLAAIGVAQAAISSR